MTLYVVGTPIGNLEDISQRALRVLREVALIAAEDTRKTKKLLSFYGIKTPLTSFHEFSEADKVRKVIATLRTKDVALVSEAGMPGISDPGYALVVAAIANGLAVVPVPGPSAVVTALSVSGLPADQFLFVGFLPRRSTERGHLLKEIASERRTIVVFEAPHRLRDSLAQVLDALGDRRITVCRELTKVHEEIWHGRIGEALQHFFSPLGEFTLVIEGNRESPAAPAPDELAERLRALTTQGLSSKEAISRLVEETNLPRRQVYRAWLALGGKQA